MSSNRSRQSKTFVEKRRRRLVIGASATAVALVAWAFALSRISYVSMLQISSVSVYSPEQDLVAGVQSAALRALDGSYLGLFSKANTLIYPKGALELAAASTSPRIATVQVSRSGLNALTVSVSERAPAAVVCADLPDLSEEQVTAADHCYLADAEGLLFKPVSGADAGSYVRYYMPDLADGDIAGSQATSTAAFKRLTSLVDDLRTAGIQVQSMLVKGDGSYELYASNPGDPSLVVIQMDSRSPLGTQRDNLVAFWERMIADARAKGAKPPIWAEIKVQYPPNVYSRPAAASHIKTP